MTSCNQNNNTNEAKQLKEKSQKKDSILDIQEINWSGIWTYTDNAPVEYTLKIENKEKLTCIFNATGIQTYYELECKGINKGDYFELYFVKILDGVFYGEDKIIIEKPILTLKLEKGKIVTYWDQLYNNYVEEGNHDGQICFEK